MLAEEKALREWKWSLLDDKRQGEFCRAITTLVKAVREDERARVVRCLNDNFVDLPDEWHRGYNKALRDACDWAGCDYDPAIRRKGK